MSGLNTYIGLFCLTLFVGCTEDKDSFNVKDRNVVIPGMIITNSCEIGYRELGDSEKVVIVGDKFLTKGEIEREKKAYLTFLRAYKPDEYQNHQKDGYQTIVGSLVAKFLYQSVLTLESESLKIIPAEQFVNEAWSAVSNYCRNAKITYSQFISSYKGGENALRKKVLTDARVKTFFAVKFKDKLSVTQEEIDALYQSIVDGNKESAKTNELYALELLDLRKEIISNKIVFVENLEDKKIPDEYEVEHFADAPIDRFDDEEKFAIMANNTPISEWSTVVDTGDTLDIYMLTNIVPKSAKTPTLYSGVRVYREKDHGYLLPSKEQLREDIRKRKNIAVLEPYVKELQVKYGVTFPYGYVWQNVKPTSEKGKTK